MYLNKDKKSYLFFKRIIPIVYRIIEFEVGSEWMRAVCLTHAS